MRLLERFYRYRDVLKAEVRPRKIDDVGREGLTHHREHFREHRLRLGGVVAVEGRLDRRDPAPHAHLEPAVAELVEHRDLFGEPQRVIERQEIDHRTETEPLRSLREGRQEDTGRRRHPERRRVVLRHVIAVETGLVVGFGDAQSLVVEVAQRDIASVEVVENAKSHDLDIIKARII
jgi:hypothetical protein